MIEKAIKKLQAEAEKATSMHTKMIAMQTIDNITSDNIAKKILKEGKSLKGCKSTFDKFAAKNKKGNESCISPDQAQKLIGEYYEFEIFETTPQRKAPKLNKQEEPSYKKIDVLSMFD